MRGKFTNILNNNSNKMKIAFKTSNNSIKANNYKQTFYKFLMLWRVLINM